MKKNVRSIVRIGSVLVALALVLCAFSGCAAAVTSPAYITVTSSPSEATVLVDGVYAGVTPLYDYGVSSSGAETHTVTVSKTGYSTASGNVTLSSGDKTSLHYELSALPGYLVINSNPSGATISIDGKNVGTTPLSTQELSAGTYQVTATKSGYVTTSKSVSVISGETRTITLDLPVLSTSYINTIPSLVTQGEKLTVSGTTTGHTNELVLVELSSVTSVSKTANIGSDGSWSVSFDTSAMNAGEYTVSITVGSLDAVTEKTRIAAATTSTPTVTPTSVSTTSPTQSSYQKEQLALAYTSLNSILTYTSQIDDIITELKKNGATSDADSLSVWNYGIKTAYEAYLSACQKGNVDLEKIYSLRAEAISVYTEASQSLNEAKSTATVVATASPTVISTVSPTVISTVSPTVISTVSPTVISTPIQLSSSSSASKSTFNTTTLIIIISALVVIIAGTVIIVRLTKRPKKTEKATVTKVEQKDIHVTVNGNVYSDVGVVASDNAIVNRPTVTNELKKTCPNCGAELKDDDKFCSKCGKQL